MSPVFGETVPRKSQRQENVPSHIFTPRSYQVEILDTAIRRNTIVCLGSSTGKAFISTMLIKGLAHQVRPSYNQGGRRTIFLANTREDVEYQAGVIARETHLSVGRYATCRGVTKWTKDRWDRILNKHQVLAMTPNVLLKMFSRDLLTFSNINLIIFDECELAVKDEHPYSSIMKAYLEFQTGELPRILGLTATVLSDGVSTPDELEKKIKRLETTLNSTAGTSTDMIVADLYGAKPKELVVQCEGYVDKTGMVARIEEIINAALSFLDNCNMTWDETENQEDPKIIPRIVYAECLSILHLLGPWCAGRVAQTFCKQLYKMEDVEVGKTHKLMMQMTHTTLQMIHTMVDYEYENTVQCLEDFLQYMSPKVLKLLEILTKYKPDDNFMIIGGNDTPDMDFAGDASDDSFSSDEEDDGGGGGGGGGAGAGGGAVVRHTKNHTKESKPQVHYVAMKRTVTGENGAALEKPVDDSLCGIIFVERRHTAFALNKLIQEMCNWNPDLYFIQSCHITGKSNHKPRAGVREAEVVHRKQEEVLRQFRNKEVNLLVSTNLLEEGVDVPRCNLVFRFDAPTDYRSYVQSKGRARAPRSTFYMLVDEPNTETFTKNLDIFKGIENILLGRCQCRDELGEESVDTTQAEDMLPDYVPNPNNPAVKVSMSSAILLVNRYCAKLPSDAFTHLTPKCIVRQDDRGLYIATLQLPINSPIKEPITGEPMRVKRLAKMAVALKTAQILHEKGELDDNLLPVGKEVIRYEDEEGEWEETQGQARPGTTKRKQYYYKKPADALLGHPKIGKQCYLYTVRMILSCPITEEQNTRGRKIHDPDETPRGFGILSEKPIPLVPRFPVFTRSGEVTTSIDLVSDNMTITETDYQRFKHFHHTVFTHVLRLEKDPMKFDLDNAVTSYIIVPILRDTEGSFSIDWTFIDVVEAAPLSNNRRAAAEKEKEEFHFKKVVFEDAVVMPSYRNIDQPQYFYVAEIRSDLNPKSPFPSPELYDTFEHYYVSKYSLEITNNKQPLLDVDHTSARLNLLTPRYMNQKGVALPTSSAETRRARRENLQQKQILVPELCDVHPFPASLWRKAVCLPAILYRINCLLIADEIRMIIAAGAHIGKVKLPADFRFPQLEFGFSTKPSDAIQERRNSEDDSLSVENPGDSSSAADKDTKVNALCSDNDNTESQAKDDLLGTSEETADGIGDDKDNTDSDVKDDAQDSSETADVCSSVGEDLPSECIELEKRPVSEKSEPQDKMADPIENDPSFTDCKCGCINKDNSEGIDSTVDSGDDKEGTRDESSPQRDKQCSSKVPIDSPLFIDTNPRYSQVLTGQEDSTFHTPRLSPHDLVNGPSSQTSVSSFHTADTSLSPGPSPAHMRRQQVDEQISENGDLMLSPDELPPSGVQQSPDPTSTVANSGLIELGKKSTDCDMDAVTRKVEDCLCTRNNTLKMPYSPQHSQNLMNGEVYPEEDTTTVSNDLVTPSQSQEAQDISDPSNTIESSSKDVDDNLEQNHLYEKEIVKSTVPWSGLDDFECTDDQENKCNTTDNDQVQDDNTQHDKGETSEEEDKEADDSDSDDDSSDDSKEDETEDDDEEEEEERSEEEEVTEDNIEPVVTFDKQIDLDNFIGPSPCIILQTMTMSNANDFFNLERLETIGDSFLKFAITVYLYCSYPGIHEGKLSYLRSKQVSNYNLYKLGKKKGFPDCMVAAKFEPTENWLPPGFVIKTSDAYKGINVVIASTKNKYGTMEEPTDKLSGMTPEEKFRLELEEATRPEECEKSEDKGEPRTLIPYNLQTQHSLPDKSIADCVEALIGCYLTTCGQRAALQFMSWLGLKVLPELNRQSSKSTTPGADTVCSVTSPDSSLTTTVGDVNPDTTSVFPHNAIATTNERSDASEVLNHSDINDSITTTSIPATSGATNDTANSNTTMTNSTTGSSNFSSNTAQCPITRTTRLATTNGNMPLTINHQSSKSGSSFGQLQAPCSPLHVPDAVATLNHQLDGYEAFEKRIQYTFRDRAYLLQAFTHASYHYNNITDCYQRLEFLGDAILDYVITRHLFEDVKKHSPGILTDLRSALVNNNIFAALAVKWDFHKFFKAISPQLFYVIEKFVARQKEKHDEISLDEEFDMGEEDNGQEVEDIEIPKALGDIFESVAGAIYLDSGMSLDTVWRVYYRLMKPQIDMFTAKIPKSPVRELLELEPETAKFEKPERTLDGKIRVMVNVVGKGEFRGIGRNYRIAKSAAAKRALKMIRLMEEQMVHHAMQALKFGLPQFTHHQLGH